MFTTSHQATTELLSATAAAAWIVIQQVDPVRAADHAKYAAATAILAKAQAAMSELTSGSVAEHWSRLASQTRRRASAYSSAPETTAAA